MLRAERVLLLAGMVCAVPAFAAEVDALIEGARKVDPQLVSLQAQRDAAKVRRGQAGSWVSRNPELAIGAGARNGAAQSLELEVALTQELELFGQRGARVDARDAELTALGAAITREAARVEADVRVAYAQLLRARAQVLLEEQAQRNAELALKTANERQRAGAGTLLERNASRLQLAGAQRQVLNARAARFAAAARLALLAGVSEEQVAALRGSLQEASTSWMAPPPAASGDVPPAVATARAELTVARAEERGARAAAFPTVDVGVQYAREEEANIVMGTLALPLPVFLWNQGDRATATAKVKGAEAALARAERAIAPSTTAARERYEAARTAVELFDGATLKAAAENLDLGTQAYAAGKLSFTELLLIRGDALEVQRAHLEALSTLAETHAELARVSAAGE